MNARSAMARWLYPGIRESSTAGSVRLPCARNRRGPPARESGPRHYAFNPTLNRRMIRKGKNIQVHALDSAKPFP
jgi:hypothetical protein